MLTQKTNARHQVLPLRESGLSVAEVGKTIDRCALTVLSLHNALKAGGWAAVCEYTLGRPRAGKSQTVCTELSAPFVTSSITLCTTDLFVQWLCRIEGKPLNPLAAPHELVGLIAIHHVQQKSLPTLGLPPTWSTYVAQLNHTANGSRLRRIRLTSLSILRWLLPQPRVCGHAVLYPIRTVAARPSSSQATQPKRPQYNSNKG